MTELETAFLLLCRAYGLPEPEHDVRFHPVRRWRADFLWRSARIIVECEGGTYSAGRHVRGQGYREDCAKYNAAVALGWRVYRCTTDMVRDGAPELMAALERDLME